MENNKSTMQADSQQNAPINSERRNESFTTNSDDKNNAGFGHLHNCTVNINNFNDGQKIVDRFLKNEQEKRAQKDRMMELGLNLIAKGMEEISRYAKERVKEEPRVANTKKRNTSKRK